MSLSEQDDHKGQQGEEQEPVTPTGTADAQEEKPTSEDALDMSGIAEEVLAETRKEPQATEPEGEEESDPDDPPKDEDQDGEPAKAEAEGEEPPAEEASGDDDRLSDDEMKALPSRVRRRFGTLTRKRKEAEEQAEALQGKLDEQTEVVDGYIKLATEMQEHGLNGQHLSQGLQFMAILNRDDPAEMRQIIEPLYQGIMQRLGEQLDPEIQKQVDAGEITEQAARDWQRAKMASQHHEAANRRREQETRQQREAEERRQQETQQQRETIAASVNGAMGALRRRHTSFEARSADFQREVEALVAERGPAKSPEEGIAMVNDAWDRVVEKARPQRQPVTPPPRSQGARPSAGTGDSLLDDIHKTVQRMRAG